MESGLGLFYRLNMNSLYINALQIPGLHEPDEHHHPELRDFIGMVLL